MVQISPNVAANFENPSIYVQVSFQNVRQEDAPGFAGRIGLRCVDLIGIPPEIVYYISGSCRVDDLRQERSGETRDKLTRRIEKSLGGQWHQGADRSQKLPEVYGQCQNLSPR